MECKPMENYKKLKSIKEDFSSYFGMAGYHRIPSSPIIPLNDESILFSNSAILPFKPFLSQESPKLFNIQKCIRFRGGKDLFNLEESPYMSTFDMVGCIVPATSRRHLFEDSQDFLLGTLNINPHNLYIDASSKDKTLADLFSKDYKIVYDRFPQEKYEGNFGMPSISGRCVHFSMLYGNGKTHNFGKIIEIHSGNKVSNYAFGFGLEKYLYMHDNRENYYEATSIYDVTKDIKSPIAWKYMNDVSALCHLYSEKIDYDVPEYAKQKKIVKSLLYKLAVTCELLDIPEARLRRDIELYSKIEYDGQVQIDKLMADFNQTKSNNALKNKKIQSIKKILVLGKNYSCGHES